MTNNEPTSARSLVEDSATGASWEEARWRLEEGEQYWVATVGPTSRPHLMPVLAVWLEDALHFCTGTTTRKGKNLATDPHCSLATESHNVHLVVEGEAITVGEDAKLRRVADAYATKYDWEVEIRDGAFYADGAPTAGPPPYDVYEVSPATVFGFSLDGSLTSTRWGFAEENQ